MMLTQTMNKGGMTYTERPSGLVVAESPKPPEPKPRPKFVYRDTCESCGANCREDIAENTFHYWFQCQACGVKNGPYENGNRWFKGQSE